MRSSNTLSNAPVIEIPLIKGIFPGLISDFIQSSTRKLRRCPDFNTFKNDCFKILKSRASTRLS